MVKAFVSVRGRENDTGSCSALRQAACPYLEIRVLYLRVVFMLSGANQGLSIRRTIYQTGDSSTPSAEMSKNDQLD